MIGKGCNYPVTNLMDSCVIKSVLDALGYFSNGQLPEINACIANAAAFHSATVTL